MCVLSNEKIHSFEFEHLKRKSSELKNIKPTYTTANDFSDGKKIDTYDYLVVNIMDEEFTADDLEMQEDLHKYYSMAVVYAWITPNNDGLA